MAPFPLSAFWCRAGDEAADLKEPIWKVTAMTYVNRFVPVSVWYHLVTPKTLMKDCIAGFIVGVMIVPTSLSWSSLAGLPLSCGLIAALVASFSYGTFGQCASLSIGPVAEITTLLISIPGISLAERQDVFQSLGVQVGVLSMILSFVDCGTVIKTIFAKAVGDGYTCAAALLAIAAQLKVMFNVSPEDRGYGNFLNTLIALVSQWSMNCLYCFALFLVYCTYLIQIKKTRLPIWIPHQLIVVVVSIFVTWGLQLDERLNLAIVRDIPAKLSWPHIPPMDNIIGLGPYTLTITVISFVQMYVVAQRVMPDIDPNAELFAGGITNLLVNLMSGMPVSNSFSCSSVLIEQKVHTPLTAYSAGTVVLITVLFLTRLGVFYYLPKQALAAIVVSSVWRLVNFSGPAQLWRYSRKDAGVWVLTFVLTVVGGITIGVLSGIAFSLILVVLRIARPRAVSVGFNMQTFRYGDIRKDPELLVYPNILLWRFDAPLYFINTSFFQERLVAAITAEVRPIDVVLVTCGKVVDIDAAALASLPLILDSIAKLDPARPRRIILTDIHGRLEKVLLNAATLPIYVPEEYHRLSIEQIISSGKFPVVFKKLEEAIAFAQRCISERYGNVDTAPYPNVSFLTDVVVEAARLPTRECGAPSLLSLLDTEIAGTATVEGATGGQATSHLGRFAPQNTVSASVESLTKQGRASDKTSRAARSGSVTVVAGDDDDVGVEESSRRAKESLIRHLATLKKLSTYSSERELVGVLGVIRHGEVTPKQKKKLLFNDPSLMRLAFQGRDLRHSRRTVNELEEFFAVVEHLLQAARNVPHITANSGDRLEASMLGSVGIPAPPLSPATVENWERVLAIVRSRPEGLKLQVKARLSCHSDTASFTGSGMIITEKQQQHPSDSAWRRVGAGGVVGQEHHYSSSVSGEEDNNEPTAGLLVVKWGGVLTKSGISQAHIMGEKLFARFYAAGDLPLQRLVQFTRHPLVTASDENRVVNTALVVANALTQTSGIAVRRGDIILDDALTKTLGPAAKRLLREEYKYFEALLHVDSAAAARHFFHIPGFRQLLWIPPLDRPLWVQESEGGDEDNHTSDDTTHHIGRIRSAGGSDVEMEALSGVRGRGQRVAGGDCFSGSSRARTCQTHVKDFRFLRSSDAFSLSEQPQQRKPNYNVLRQDEFYTPFQVLQELEELMNVLSTLEFPPCVAKAALSNHETLEEVQRRYEAMLHNFRGAKRNIRAGGRASTMRDRASSSVAPLVEVRSACSSNDAATARERESPESQEQQQRLLEAMEETGGSSDDEGLHAQLHGKGFEAQTARLGLGTDDSVAQTHILKSPSGRSGISGGGSITQRGQTARGTAIQDTPPVYHTWFGPLYAPPGYDGADGLGGGPGHRDTIDGNPRFDVSDVSKLRDYGSYDVAYNLPRVLQLHASAQDPLAAYQLRRFARSLQRFFEIVECLSRIGENVLEGVNSSKRFIIGSLVSDELLRRLYTDYRDLAVTDEERGVQELLLKAQAQYMAENGGVEQDVRYMISLFSRLPCWPTTTKQKSRELSGKSTAGTWANETVQEREFRLRFPFISLPKQDASVCAATNDFTGCTRLYFTSYLHVEGVLQCLFESATVEGFSRPSKEEMEATHQLYMRHLIFKIFRRRNVSFTEAEAAAAMRRLHLLFRSDVEYDKQQEELRRGLSAIYHAMYYVSMEVYLSLGDVDDAQTAITERFPLLHLGDITATDAQSSGDGVPIPSVSLINGEDVGQGGQEQKAATVHSAAAMISGQNPANLSTTSLPLPPPETSASLARMNNGVSSLTGKLGRTAADAGGNSDVEALALFARSPLYLQHCMAASADSERSAASGLEKVGTAEITPPRMLAPVATNVIAGHETESNMGSDGDGSLNRPHLRSNNVATHPSGALGQRTASVRRRSVVSAPATAKDPVKEATVLVTPEAGRRTAVVQEMKYRVSSVTPMRRIHEGLSLEDLLLLMKEVESAVWSQTCSSP